MVPEEAHNEVMTEFTSKSDLVLPYMSGQRFNLNCIRMKGVGAPIAHTIAHYYATGAYETIATVAYGYTSLAKAEYRRSVEIYMAAKKYKLAGLQELAKGHMTDIATQMPTSEIFNVLGDVNWDEFDAPYLDDVNPDKWITEVHFRKLVKAACKSESDQLDGDFRDFSQLNRTLRGRFVQVITDILREVYLEKLSELVKERAALKESEKMKHQPTPTSEQEKEEAQECSQYDEMEEMEGNGADDSSEDGSVTTPERITSIAEHLESCAKSNISTMLFYPARPSY